MSTQYAAIYSPFTFRNKLLAFARAAGREVVGRALQLYYAAHAPGTPRWAKAAIYGALGYFISFVDVIPDLTPVLGYTDDLAVLTAALATVVTHVTPEVKAQAAAKLEQWFPR